MVNKLWPLTFMEKLITTVRIQLKNAFLNLIIIKFPYNARSDWLKQRALSEIRKQVDDI